MIHPRYVKVKDVLSSDFGDEIVALNMKSDMCFGLNETASAIYNCLEEPRSAEEICLDLVKDFAVNPEVCLREVEATLIQFLNDGLARLAD